MERILQTGIFGLLELELLIKRTTDIQYFIGRNHSHVTEYCGLQELTSCAFKSASIDPSSSKILHITLPTEKQRVLPLQKQRQKDQCCKTASKYYRCWQCSCFCMKLSVKIFEFKTVKYQRINQFEKRTHSRIKKKLNELKNCAFLTIKLN